MSATERERGKRRVRREKSHGGDWELGGGGEVVGQLRGKREAKEIHWTNLGASSIFFIFVRVGWALDF